MSELDLKVPQPPPAPKKQYALHAHLFQGAVLLLLAAAVYGVYRGPAAAPPPPAAVLPPEAKDPNWVFREELVLKLKNAGAYREAAAELYRAATDASLPRARRALLLKRQGDLLADGGEHGAAVLAYYRAAELNEGEGKDADLARDLDQAVVELLRTKGLYGAVSSELARQNRERQGVKRAGKDPVVAKVDGKELTMSDFEAELAEQVEARVRSLTADAKTKEEADRRAGEIRKQYAAPAEKLRCLQEQISADILYREALAKKLESHPEYEKQLDRFRRDLLRQLFLETTLGKVEVSDLELKNYSEAHRAELGFSTGAGALSSEDLARVRPQAEERYRKEKGEELGKKLQADLSARHQVEVMREPFTEGAR